MGHLKHGRIFKMIWYETWYHDGSKWHRIKSDKYHSMHSWPHEKFDKAVTFRYNDEVEWPRGIYADVIRWTKLKKEEHEARAE